MEREQTTIRLPVELKEKLQQEASIKEYTKPITLRIKKDLYEELKVISKQSGLTVTSVLIVAIWKNVLKLNKLQQ